ncbi:MAG TPA: hypothetical protein VMO47_18705, partial [Rhodothermales bacterium]|nr:hypothetical protein [Rhodothermales bacterium]
DRTNSLTAPPYAFRVTDFGVASAASELHLLDDFDQLAVMLRELLEGVNYQASSAEDRFIFDWLNDDLLGKTLLERDSTHEVRARDPVALYRSLQDVRGSYRSKGVGQTRKTLATPFDYLSCEQLGESHALLKELYSDKMLGLPALEDRNNLVVTGPRGCGKTTVFRSLSLRHRHYTDDDVPTSLRYLGVYYRCDDLYFTFPRYKVPEQEEGLDIPIHFLTATLIRESLEVLALWFSRRFPDEWATVESAAAAALWEALGLAKPNHPAANTFESLRRALEVERTRAARKQRFIGDPTHPFREYFGPEVLPRICEILAKHFSGLHDRPIFFFIDDYSNPKVNLALQKSLNRLVMQRSAACFFKLATESPSSFSRDDIDGKSYVESREFRMLNLGIDFIHAERDDKLRFVDDVFGRRFEYTEGYPVQTLEALIGTDGAETSQNEVARAIRQKSYPVIWGRHALAELCSGDVHFVIELVGKMVTRAGGPDALKSEAVPSISGSVQNKTIREEAGNFLRNLRALPTGPALVEVVQAFGAIAGSYLRHRDSKNEEAAPPHQASRIEPYDDPHLTGAAKQVYDDLLRYSVFIEDVRGKSRRGSFVPRLYLRRFLLPFFNLTFSKRDSIELSVDEFRELLLSPNTFSDRKRLKERADDSVPESPRPDTQMPLFLEPGAKDDGEKE